MPKPVRQSGRLWEQHKDTIIACYKDNRLTEVMDYMEKVHDFKATKMAFKKKLGRWDAPGKRKRAARTTEMNDTHLQIEENEPTSIEVPCVASIASSNPDCNETQVPASRTLPSDAQTFDHDECIGDLISALEGVSPRQKTSATEEVSPHEETHVMEEATTYRVAKASISNFLTLSTRQRNKIEEDAIEDALAEFWTSHPRSQDLSLAKKILSAYYMLLGSKNHAYLFHSKEFCKKAMESSEQSFDVADLFYRTIRSLEKENAVLRSKQELQRDVLMAVTLLHRGNWSAGSFNSTLASLEKIYPSGQSDLCSSKALVCLYTLEASLHLLNLSGTSPTNRFGRSSLRNGIQHILGMIFQQRSPGGFPLFWISDEEKEFIHDAMVLLHRLWDQQCSMRKNWLWTSDLVDLVKNLDDNIAFLDFTSLEYYEAICSVILIPWHQRLGNHSLVRTWSERLYRHSSGGSSYEKDITLLKKQFASNLPAAIVILKEDKKEQDAAFWSDNSSLAARPVHVVYGQSSRQSLVAGALPNQVNGVRRITLSSVEKTFPRPSTSDNLILNY